MMNVVIKRALVVSLAAVSLVLPFSVQAATFSAQAVANKAWQQLLTSQKPYSSNSMTDFEFTAQDKSISAKKNNTIRFSFRASSAARVVEPANAMSGQESSTTLENLKIFVGGNTSINFNLPEQLKITSRIVDSKMYIQLVKLPSSLVALIQEDLKDFKPENVVGKWIMIDVADMRDKTAVLVPMPNIDTPAEMFLTEPNFIGAFKKKVVAAKMEATLLDKAPVNVMGVDKRWTENGQPLMRVRLKLNPAWLTGVEQMVIKSMNAKSKTYKKDLADFRATTRIVKQYLNTMTLAAVLNENTADVVRFELGTKGSYLAKLSPKEKTLFSWKVTSAANIKYGPQQPVVAPEGAMSAEELMIFVKSSLQPPVKECSETSVEGCATLGLPPELPAGLVLSAPPVTQ